jgi:hypothetical protein
MIEQLETRLLMSVSVDPSDPSSDPALTTDTQIIERRLATSRQQLLSTMVLMGTNSTTTK